MAMATTTPTEEKLKAENDELREQNKALAKSGAEAKLELGEARAEISNLRSFIKQADEKDYELGYALEPISFKKAGAALIPNACSRYDGMLEDPPVCIWHESISFMNDSGFDRSVILDRATHSVRRAFGDDSADRIAPDCSNLPPFSKELSLEIILRIVPQN